MFQLAVRPPLVILFANDVIIIIGSRGIAGVRTSDFVLALLLARSQVGRYCSIFRIKLSVMHVV